MVPSYAWSQTRQELTLTLPLPAGTAARRVSCTLSPSGVLRVDVMGLPSPVLEGTIPHKAELNTWTVDSGTLYIEIDKAAPKFWPCATVGGPEVDVRELIAAEKREREPAFKPSPGAQAKQPDAFVRWPCLHRPPSPTERRRAQYASTGDRSRDFAEVQGRIPAAGARAGRQSACRKPPVVRGGAARL